MKLSSMCGTGIKKDQITLKQTGFYTVKQVILVLTHVNQVP